MTKAADTLDRLREICLMLPDTREGTAWRHPVFRVGNKLFCGYEELDGKWTVGFKAEAEHAEQLRDDTRGVACQNFGKHKWVSIDAGRIDDWEGIAGLILESYRLSAPKRSLAKLDISSP
jgi:predicted DNA-binding protein (MmcQ/YjbR family)